MLPCRLGTNFLQTYVSGSSCCPTAAASRAHPLAAPEPPQLSEPAGAEDRLPCARRVNQLAGVNLLVEVIRFLGARNVDTGAMGGSREGRATAP